MKADPARLPVETFEISKEIEISAPIDMAWEAMLEQLGPQGEMMDGKPFPMKIEPWPGGRWYRDLGNHAGHLWGHVQVVKPPTLLEICGPLMMSYAAVNHLQYRLTAQGNVTRMTFLHRSLGAILPEHREGMPKGWQYWLERIRDLAERKNKKGIRQ
jgi:uncharacterized protein YndB with AHSA1/START domain